ncbi:MAG: MFS transporter [Lachnospiraceae bacterium]|nr:MFS transporter [Lachnospiraceae bacterium]
MTEKKSKRNEGLLFFGRWTSKIGDIVFDYVNSVVLVHAFTKSSWVLALYQSSQTIVQIIFNLIGGAIADGGKRKKILITTDLLSAIVCLIASFFVQSKLVAVALISANALLALIFAFSSPTFKAIVREMVSKERIVKYNSISNAGKELISMAGPIIGVALMSLVGARGSLIINAITFFISAISECLLVKLESEEKKEDGKEKKNIIKDIKEGLKYLYNEKPVFALLVLSALVNFFLAGYNLLLPYTDIMYEGVFEGFYAKAMAAEAIGAILGSLINSKIPSSFSNKYSSLTIFLGLNGASLLLVPLVNIPRNQILCLLPIVLFGASLTIFNINLMSYVQVNVAEEFLGRVFSVIFTVAVMFMPLGSWFFSIFNFAENINSFAIVGAGIVVLSLIYLFFVHPGELKESK